MNRFSNRRIFHIAILTVLQIAILQAPYNGSGENLQDSDGFIIKVKGIRNAVDAYRIRHDLSSLEGVEKVFFNIPGSEEFRGCCRISDDYNLHLKSLEFIPLVVSTHQVPASRILDFLRQSFDEFSFELLK